MVPSSIHVSWQLQGLPSSSLHTPALWCGNYPRHTHLFTNGFAAVLIKIPLSCTECPHLELLSMEPQAFQQLEVALQGQAAIRLQQGSMHALSYSQQQPHNTARLTQLPPQKVMALIKQAAIRQASAESF